MSKLSETPHEGKSSFLNDPEFIAAQERICDDDREWLLKHPHKFIRVREATKGDPYEGRYILVFSPFKNASLRWRAGFSAPPGQEPPTDNPTLICLLHHMLDDFGHPGLLWMFWHVMAKGGCIDQYPKTPSPYKPTLN